MSGEDQADEVPEVGGREDQARPFQRSASSSEAQGEDSRARGATSDDGAKESDLDNDNTLRRLLAESRAAISPPAEAEQQWRLVLETAYDAFVGANERGEIIDWNRRAEEIFGWSTEEIIGRPLAETIVPALSEGRCRGLLSFFETGEGPVLFQRLELPALQRDGHLFDAEITIWPSRSGARYRFNAFIRDISARTRAEAYVGLLQRVAVAANGAPTAEGAVRSALGEVCSVTGWPLGHAYRVEPGSARRLTPTGWWHDASKDDFAAFRAVTEQLRLERGMGLPGRVLETGEPAWIPDLSEDGNFLRYDLADEIRVRSGFAFPVLVGVEVAAVLEFFAGEPTEPDEELLAVMANVGTQLGRVFERERTARELERKNLELQAAAELKSRFVSVVSHELRSPLAAILGFAALMDLDWDELDEEDKRNYVRSIERQSRRLNRLVEDLLLTTRLETGSVEARFSDFDLCEVIHQAVGDLKFEVANVDCGEGMHVHADPDHVTQILVNFLTNAVRHGAPPIQVVVEPDVAFVDVRVCDAGPGIAEGFLPRLFQPFARARGVKSGGSGLGLSIVRGLARANGGDSWYEPVEPHGACFVVRLPAASTRSRG